MKVALLVPALLLCGFRPTNETIIEGHFISKTYARIDGIPVLLKRQDKIIAADTSDEYGDFTISINEGSGANPSLYLLYISTDKDTVLLKKYNRLEEQITKEIFNIP
jgi:hypothetical protein